jgi:hypothetical protein
LIAAACHCGRIQLEVARAPRLGYRRHDVQTYVWGDRKLRFIRCRACGCVLHHERTRRSLDGVIGVNARNFEPAVIARARIRRLDGAATWKYLD